VVRRLAQQRAQEGVILERGKLWHGRQSKSVKGLLSHPARIFLLDDSPFILYHA
jgi:hypothetical protein